MKTKMFPGITKLLGGLLITVFLVILLLAYLQTAQNLTVSVGWHDFASVGWVTAPV